LNVIRDKFNLTFENLETTAEYAEFVKSPEYAEWLESQTEKP
jgi:hypothetical protein